MNFRAENPDFDMVIIVKDAKNIVLMKIPLAKKMMTFLNIFQPLWKWIFYLVSTSTIETRSVFDETVIFYPSTATDDADFLINWKKKFFHAIFPFWFLSLF